MVLKQLLRKELCEELAEDSCGWERETFEEEALLADISMCLKEEKEAKEETES